MQVGRPATVVLESPHSGGLSIDPSILLGLALILISAFFVAAEYALIGARRSSVEALARSGNRSAKLLVRAMNERVKYVAGIQVAITMTGIGLGVVAEPAVMRHLQAVFGLAVPRAASLAVALIATTFAMVVVGELVPKYLTLRMPERLALVIVRPLHLSLYLLAPLAWLAQRAALLLLRPFGLHAPGTVESTVTKDELVMLVKAGESGGLLEEQHATLLGRALRFDKLDVADIMIHRVDIEWIDAVCTRDELLRRLAGIPHTRIPVCRGDIDDMLGILYVQDVLRNLENPDFQLESALRPIVAVPENLTLNRAVNTMRETKSQILIIVDEYGGTAGLVTLEDVVEEIFGELDDQIESERPPIERVGHHRVSARADVRYDELIEFLGRDSHEATTDTLATVIVERLGRVPKLGDTVDDEVGKLRVENMARRRITRVSIHLPAEETSERVG